MAAFSLVRRSPGLAGLLAAQTISPLGDAMATTALILHIQRTTGSATAVGLLLFAQAIPPLAAPLAGVVADRVAPGRLLGAGWLAQAVLAGLLALSLPPLGALLAVVFALALLDTPLSAAVGRCIPAVVADEDLVAANTLRGGVQELGTVLGPPLAGLLFAASGARLVLGLDALTFLIVIPLALRLPAPPRDTTVRSRLSFAHDARDGLAFVWRTRSVLAIALGFWVVVLFSAPDDLILPFLATLTFKAGPVAIGLLLAAASAGLLAGLPFVRPAGRRLGVTGAIVAGFAVMAAGNLLTAAAPWLMAAFAAQALRGLAIPLADAHVTTHLQRTTPPELLGRVLANVYGGVGVAAAVGYVIGGPVVDATSPRTAFVIVGCGGLAGAAVTALLLRGQSGRSRARTSAVRSKDLCRTGTRGQHPDGDLFLSDRSCIVPVMPRPREFEPDQVLDSAMRHFWERGYRATSVDDLVRATGVKPGSLYSAFPGGKHALLMGSLERYSKLVVPQKLGELDEPGASVAQVRAYFDGLVQDLLSPEGRQGCLLVNSAIENAATDPEVAAVVRGHLARLERCFTAALGTAIRRGEIPASVDPASRAKGLVATSQGLMVIGKANPDEEVLRAVVDSAFAGLS